MRGGETKLRETATQIVDCRLEGGSFISLEFEEEIPGVSSF